MVQWEQFCYNIDYSSFSLARSRLILMAKKSPTRLVGNMSMTLETFNLFDLIANPEFRS